MSIYLVKSDSKVALRDKKKKKKRIKCQTSVSVAGHSGPFRLLVHRVLFALILTLIQPICRL